MNQIYSAFEKEKNEAFTRKNGIKVQVYTAPSPVCISFLMTDLCDIASSARLLYRRLHVYGITQIPICKDPLAVITKKGCRVDNLSEKQVQDIFSGDITNWKELGGADLPIRVIVPADETAVNKNFRRHFMKHKEIEYDFMTYESTMALEAVKYFPCGSISFISQGAALHYKDIKAIKINGFSPTDEKYPYYQIFYYITRGKPAGHVKEFIDFTFSSSGTEIVIKNGMMPIHR